MRFHLSLVLALSACAASKKTPAPPLFASAGMPEPAVEDPNLWLEDTTGERSMAWVKEQNARATKSLGEKPELEALRAKILAVLDSKDKIPHAEKLGTYLYNFWEDAANPRGILRRTSLAEYKKPKPAWETVLDLDALGKAEHESWVWAGSQCLRPKYERCLVSLSRGGGDSVVVREFDAKKKAFVQGGFTLPEAKSQVAWQDENHVFVGTDFGPGSLTDSGYPRIAKLWQRGTPLASATVLLKGQKTDVSVGAQRSFAHDKRNVHDLVSRSITFNTNETYLLDGATLVLAPIPHDADLELWSDQVLVSLRTAWTVDDRTFAPGTKLAGPFEGFFGKREVKDGVTRGVLDVAAKDLTVLYEPAPNRSLAGTTALKSGLVLTELEDVHSKLYAWRRKASSRATASPLGRKEDQAESWTRTPLSAPALGYTIAYALEDDESDDFWMTSTDFTTPSTLSLASLGKKPVQLKQSPTFFDASNLVTEQHFATSTDGTKVPYYQVAKKGLVLDGNNATMLTGYGGFEVTLEPRYDAIDGVAWLERGGVFVQANIRGGGEYGPTWHEAARGPNRQHAYDDFIAIAEDLVARKVTSPKRLGIIGGSNGGLLVGVMLTERPDLFGAVVCEAPLLDMKRFNKLLSGASWMEEYGNPDVPADWAVLQKYSPYQNVKHGTHYPPTLFTTSTRDDRVHPGHARKMAARMLAEGDEVLFYENIEGGHGGSADNGQRAFMSSLAYTFLADKLKLGH